VAVAAAAAAAGGSNCWLIERKIEKSILLRIHDDGPKSYNCSHCPCPCNGCIDRMANRMPTGMQRKFFQSQLNFLGP
jgi:hypothetical protein